MFWSREHPVLWSREHPFCESGSHAGQSNSSTGGSDGTARCHQLRSGSVRNDRWRAWMAWPPPLRQAQRFRSEGFPPGGQSCSTAVQVVGQKSLRLIRARSIIGVSEIRSATHPATQQQPAHLHHDRPLPADGRVLKGAARTVLPGQEGQDGGSTMPFSQVPEPFRGPLGG